jgi:hypothetical protein
VSRSATVVTGLLLAGLLTGCALPEGEPATPQRPTYSFSPATTAAGTWELEAGGQVSPLGDYGEIPATLKYGVDGHTEAALTVSPLISVDHASGLGDTTLAWRHRFVDAEGSRPAVAWQAQLKLPTADENRGLGSGHTDGWLALTAGGASGSYGWNAYAQVGALGQEHEDADFEGDLALVGSYTLDSTHAFFAEFSDRRVPEQDSVVDQLRLGHSITVRPDLVLDWSLWLPASDDAPDTIFALGFTRNFGPRHAGP